MDARQDLPHLLINRSASQSTRREHLSKRRVAGVPGYNPPMSLSGDGSSRTEQSLAIRRIVDRIPAFTWSAHPDGSVEFVNQPWREYAGLSLGESQGWGWQIAIHPDDLASLMHKWRQLLAAGAAGDIEARMRRHDGSFRWFLIRFEPFRDETGKIAMWYGVSTDIESLKQTEEIHSVSAAASRNLVCRGRQVREGGRR